MQSNGITVSQLSEFDEIIDVRSPSEFREDHIPGAINFPVLNDEERARVGTIYKQVSAFDAKKVGAALVSRNIANHLLPSKLLHHVVFQFLLQPLHQAWFFLRFDLVK